ncbi:hypothetical protein [Rhizobium sp. FKY42]|uniref:NUDIX hydrolase n=1 Tax=Rhizobium sp. FKY42 TaxID=2562310 RepID=UPI0010BF7FDC|nr:hypothetical protein [Rhizobium sp. FKY42]
MTDLTPSLTDLSSPPLQAFSISAVDVIVEDGPHSLWQAHRAEIEAQWAVESRANHHLFDGPILLQESIIQHGDRLLATARMTRFSTLLWWRRQQDRARIRLLFGAAIPVSTDGSAIVIRMAPHTANAGRICFAAGSLDPSDVVEGYCNVIGSMNRELKEETGLDVSNATDLGQLSAAYSNGRCIVFRAVYLPWSDAEILDRVTVHMNGETLSEIDAVYAVKPDSWSSLANSMDDLTRVAVKSVFSGR